MPELLQRGDDSRKNWTAINALTTRQNELARLHVALRQDVAGLRTAADGPKGLHPFAIYQEHPALLAISDATDWRKVKIRAGRVLESEATGTDGTLVPDSGGTGTGAIILVPENTAQFWFWLEIGIGVSGETTAVVRYADDPAAEEYDDGENPAWDTEHPWTAAPKPDAHHIPIGYVDSATRAGALQLAIRQLLRGDIVSVGSGVNVLKMRFVAMGFDLITCNSGEHEVSVAKPYKLRFSVNTANINGETLTYYAHNIAAQTRFATNGVDAEKQVIVPRYLPGDEVQVLDDAQTDVETNNVAVTLLDLNVDGRAWAAES